MRIKQAIYALDESERGELKSWLKAQHSDWRVMVPHCGFDLHFSDNE